MAEEPAIALQLTTDSATNDLAASKRFSSCKIVVLVTTSAKLGAVKIAEKQVSLD